MTDTIKQVKVDNWGQFFLSKLQALYTRGDYCDLTLQFHTNESIKVHRLVLNSCTDYFENLLKHNSTGHMRLPPTLNSDVVVPIINFMYSGVLEFRPELTTRLYNTAKILKISILTTLLDTHGGPVVQSPVLPYIEPMVVSMVAPPAGSAGSNSPTLRRVPSPTTFPMTPEDATAAALMQSPPVHCKSEPVETPQPPKKLSIWKKRSTANSSSSHNNSYVTVIPQKPVAEEPAKPTRFEWPEDDSEAIPLLYSSTFDDISYDSVPIVKSINNMVKAKVTSPSQGLLVMPQQKVMPVATFESVYQSANLKRRTTSPTQSVSSPRTTKKPKVLDMNEVKEHMQELEVRKSLIAQDSEADDLDDFLPEARNDDDEEDCDPDEDIGSMSLSGEAQSSQSKQLSLDAASKKGTPKPILKVSEVTSPEVNVSKEQINASGSSKKVRFSLENKVHTLNTSGDCKQVRILSSNEGTSLPGSTANSSGPKPTVSPDVPRTPPSQETNVDRATEARTQVVKKSGDGSPQQVTVPKASSNHAKIIAEVLKKYPHLVKNNKNIRLKIMQRDGHSSPNIDPGSDSGTKSKVSYMVVKADSCLKLEDEQTSETPKAAIVATGADNTEGPWFCETCGTKENPLNFETYYTFRRHLQSAHNEKFDVRICEHCGYKATKRNLLLYHLFTKHGIPPPSNYTFPKCELCDHYALSESLLVKHRNMHSGEKDKEFNCKVCKASFKTATALQGHIQMKSHWQESNKRAFKCSTCQKSFSSQNNLRTHIKTFHKDASVPRNEDELVDDPDDVEQSTDGPQSQTYIQQCPEQQNQHVPLPEEQHQEARHLSQHQQESHMITHAEHHQEHATYILPDVSLLAGAQQGTLLQSTEAESLSNVASGIAASLGVADSMVVVEQPQPQPQTVLYLDKGQLILQTGGGNVHGLPANTHVQEYIVPEIMASDMSQGVGVYTTGQLSQIVQYATGGLQQGEPGILTIVNPNGSIVNPGQAIVQQHDILQHVPVSHSPHETSVETMAVVVPDHDYAEEGTLHQNGNAGQEVLVESNSSAVSHLPIVTVPVSSMQLPRTEQAQASELEIPKLVREAKSEEVESKVECVDEDSSNPPPVLERESPVPGDSPGSVRKADDAPASSASSKAGNSEKMAALVKDWDDFDEESAEAATVNCQPVVEEALPSRPTILLRSDMDHDDLSDNLVKIT